MLVDWNEGYISVCPTPDLIPVEDKHTYIPTSTWGYIRGDISEQKDLMNLLTTIESGLSPAQIALLVDADERMDEVKADVIELEQKHSTEISDINSLLNSKVNITDVYTKSEIDSKGYLTEHQSLAGYATENWVYQRGYISTETDPIWSAEKHKYALKTELPNVSGLASESWVKQQGYITEHQSLDNYYTKNEVDAAIENVEVDLTGYATEDWVKQQNYLTEHQSLANYYTKSEVDAAFENVEVDLTGYATESWVKDQNYLTEHQSLEGYATEDWVKEQGYITEHQSLAGYATEDWVKQQNYLTEHQSLANYYTKSEVDTAIENVEVDLTGYATESWVKDQNYLTEHQSLAGYATENWVKEQGYITEHQSLAGYATEDWVKQQNYLTEHQSLANYYTKSEVDTAIENVEVDLTGYATQEWVGQQGYLTEHQSLAGYATEAWCAERYITRHVEGLIYYYRKTQIDEMMAAKLDTNKIWSGTQAEWDALSVEQQNSYTIAMIEI